MGNNEITKGPANGFDKNPQNINRDGRPPKGYSITDAFRSMLSAEPETKAEIVRAIREKALKGDPTAQKLIWNYMDGMPVQGVELTGADGGPVEQSITVKFVSDPSGTA